MMKFFRKNVKIILWISASIFVIAIFAGFGGVFFQKRFDLVAKVNSTSFSYKTFEKLYEQYKEVYRQNKEIDKIDEETLKKIRKELLQNIIEEELLYQQAQKYDIIVTPQELINTLYSYPSFQKDGKFDVSLYFSILQYMHTTPQSFEKTITRSLTIIKLRMLFLSGIKVTTKELEYEYIKQKKGLHNFEKEKEEFYKFLLLKKQSSLFNEWIQELIRNAKINIYIEERDKFFKEF